MGTCGGKEGGGRNASINCGVSKNEFFIMAKLDMAKKFHGIWESAHVKWKLVGGKKEVEGLAVAIVEFLKLNSSITAKLDMAKKILLKWESTIVKWELVGKRRRWREWQFQFWSF